MITRRRFLGGATASLTAIGAGIPRLWLDAGGAAQQMGDGPILVVIDLDGGNDGLNTVIPYNNDLYHRNRPTIGIESKELLKLDEHVGLHPVMKELYELWDEGQCCIVQNVGYPKPNRSHSRSREIWHSGKAPAPAPDGWLGRVTDRRPELRACHIGNEALPLMLQGRLAAADSVGDLADYRLDPNAQLMSNEDNQDTPVIADIQSRFHAAGDFLNCISRVASEISESGRSAESLGGRLAIIKAMIRHNPQLRVFYTSLSGFDTHTRQRFTHESLLRRVSRDVAHFMNTLRDGGLQEQVVVLIVSEFGRRLKENGQEGTDHGAAAPVFLIGKHIKGGLLGKPPNLEDLDPVGDIRYDIDFRDVYASLLKQWLGVDPGPILGNRNSSLTLVKA